MMTNLKKAIQAMEKGLLTANYIRGHLQEKLDLRERMSYYHVPGFSIALIEQEEVIWSRGYGLMAAGDEKPVTAETIFQAASISKPVTAMVALKLVEAGLLELDTDVNDGLHSWHLPENEHLKEHKVTLRSLLSHSAGLSVFGYRGYPAGAQLPTLQQILDGKPPANSDPVRVVQTPGKVFRYSGGGYVLLQQLIEDVSGKSLADLAQEFIFNQLGMSSSTFEPLLPEAYIPKVAIAHRQNGDPVPGKWHIYPEQATASLWSTPSDLALLIIEVLKSNRNQSDLVISPEMTRKMLTPQVGWMGLGYVVVEREGWIRFDHPGWNEGYHSYMSGYLGAGQGLVWMTNGENGKLLGYEVMRALAKVFGWPEFHPVEKNTAQVDPGNFNQFEGLYRDTEYPDFTVEIVKNGEQLFLQEAQGGIRYRLYPETETVFFCLIHSDEFTFIKNSQGKVETLLIGEYSQLNRVEVKYV